MEKIATSSAISTSDFQRPATSHLHRPPSSSDLRPPATSDLRGSAFTSVSINEFLKPAEGKNYYGGGGHVKGRQNVGGNNYNSSRAAAIAIGDAGQFPSLGGK